MNELTPDDEGKPVVDSMGERIGRVSNVEHGNAFVDPDPGLTDTIKSKLGWSSPEEDDYRLESDEIDTVTDEEIRLR